MFSLKEKIDNTIKMFPWYSKLLQERSIGSITDLPLLTSVILEQHYYDKEVNDSCLVFHTSGTSKNKRKRVYYSIEDNERYLDEKVKVFGKFLENRPGMTKVVVDVGTGHAANTATTVFDRLGLDCHYIDFTRPIKEHIDELFRLKPDVLYTMPTILDHLIDASPDPKSFNIKMIILVGEIATNQWINKVANILQISQSDVIDTYGSIEVGLIAYYSHQHKRFIILDSIYAEVLPIKEIIGDSEDSDNEGILVITSMIRDTMPVLRLVTYDVVRDFRPIIIDGFKKQSFKCISRRVGTEFKHGEKISLYDIENVVYKYLDDGIVQVRVINNRLIINIKSKKISNSILETIKKEIQSAISEIDIMVKNGILDQIKVQSVLLADTTHKKKGIY